MRKLDISISQYNWEVEFVTEVTCKDLNTIKTKLLEVDCPLEILDRVDNEFGACRNDIGLTYSNHSLRHSIILIGKTSDKELFINTLAHEIHHFIDLVTMVNGVTDTELKATLAGDFSRLLTYIISDTLMNLK